MRILIVPRDFPSDEEPHAGIFVLRQARELRNLGHEIEVLRFVPKAPPLLLRRRWQIYRSIPQRYEREGIPVRAARVFVPPRLLGIGLVKAQFASPLWRTLARFRPDIVHAHCTLPTAALCSQIPLPLVVTAHGSDTYVEPWRRGDLERTARAALAQATTVVAVSAFVQHAVHQLGREDCRVVFNGADSSVFYPKARALSRDVLAVERGRAVVMFAGSLVPAKGVFDLAEALGLLNDLRPLVLIAGDGPAHSALRKRFEALGVEHRFLGQVAQSTIATALDAADVFAFPSHAEGLPSAVCEAMMSGRAVVAAGVGGIPEIIADGQTGVLVRRGEPADLAAALRRVLTDPAFRSALERNAREYALRELTWAGNAKAYEAIFREATRRYFAEHKSA